VGNENDNEKTPVPKQFSVSNDETVGSRHKRTRNEKPLVNVSKLNKRPIK
jgi:hypothetical protein